MSDLGDKLDELPDNREPFEPDAVLAWLRKKMRTTAEIAERYGVGEADVLRMMGGMYERGVLVYLHGDHWRIEKAPPPGRSNEHVFTSDADGWYRFGVSSDQHLGSKYERLDVLDDLYDKFAAAGVERVYNAGNWIDGEARFNRHDLNIHGMENQVDYLAEHYPQRDGITTYAVAGDDHEGWYCQREGVDIGRHAQHVMRDHGRSDWVDLGYMECFAALTHAGSGKVARMLVMHPGGGSAYAHSYKPQKIVESLAGGEKPAVLLVGHYHKLGYYPVRNVHVLQCGTTQDQTPFMRKKGIDAHVGGAIVELRQNADTGAIERCRVEFFSYYNRGYYNNRWSHSGPVNLADRGAGA